MSKKELIQIRVSEDEKLKIKENNDNTKEILGVKKIKEDIIKNDNKTKSVPEEHFFRLLTKCQQSLFLSKYGI